MSYETAKIAMKELQEKQGAKVVDYARAFYFEGRMFMWSFYILAFVMFMYLFFIDLWRIK